ncbi:hypothetical protein HMPREF3216_00278 [Gardnerella vaginalis]|uniref:Uncharacterized protein n=1 Tax=Gardnerella vaginalis TaxID=2702 RepID=A0A133NRE5_GARVA|nr:hypothetical protein HMPREF3216_00278 [Gardnerella vaginalis]
MQNSNSINYTDCLDLKQLSTLALNCAIRTIRTIHAIRTIRAAVS